MNRQRIINKVREQYPGLKHKQIIENIVDELLSKEERNETGRGTADTFDSRN